MNDNFYDLEENTFGNLGDDDFGTDNFDLGSSDGTFDNLSDEEFEPDMEADAPQEESEPVEDNSSKVRQIPAKQAPVNREDDSDADNADADEMINPFEAAMQKAEDEQTKKEAVSLFSKLPVFEYGGAAEEIKNAEISFEQLRIEKSTDFPELEDGKKVSWNVEYGGIKKAITKPEDTVISKVKAEIETSAEFLTALKKAKDKSPSCKVKPTIKAQSKGITAMSGYKGVFANIDEAEESDKVICIIPARDGNVYEMRKTPMGRFVTKAKGLTELSEISAGFNSALPLIPFELLREVIAFFRYFMKDGIELEALVHIYWNKNDEQYHIVVPKQEVSKAYISATFSLEDVLDDESFIHFADIHSHNSMRAKFSSVDDTDEKATRVYAVIGRLDEYFPEISVRISNGGRFLPIPVSQIFEGVPSHFPTHWTEAVHKAVAVTVPQEKRSNEI